MFEKKYKVKDLHIIRLGQITDVSNGKKTITYFDNNSYVIVQKYHYNKYTEEETHCYDLFNNTKYYLFTAFSKKLEVKYTYVAPLSVCFPNQKFVTKKELIELYNELNDINTNEEEIPQEDKENKILEDNILKLISAEIDKINSLNLKEERRLKIVNSLKDIAEYYVTNYINIKSEKQQNINFESPLTQLKLECSKKIAEIDAQLYETAQNDDLLDQLNIVKKKTLK